MSVEPRQPAHLDMPKPEPREMNPVQTQLPEEVQSFLEIPMVQESPDS